MTLQEFQEIQDANFKSLEEIINIADEAASVFDADPAYYELKIRQISQAIRIIVRVCNDRYDLFINGTYIEKAERALPMLRETIIVLEQLKEKAQSAPSSKAATKQKKKFEDYIQNVKNKTRIKRYLQTLAARELAFAIYTLQKDGFLPENLQRSIAPLVQSINTCISVREVQKMLEKQGFTDFYKLDYKDNQKWQNVENELNKITR